MLSSICRYLILLFPLLFCIEFQSLSTERVNSQLKNVLSEMSGNSASSDFAHFSIVQPSYYLHSRTKIQISSTKHNPNSKKHLSHLTIKYSLNHTLYMLDLYLNKYLLTDSYVEKHQQNGAYIIRNRTNANDIELCHYKGVLRDVPGSWVAISTCDNIIRGVIYDGSELNYIEPFFNNRTIISDSNPSTHTDDQGDTYQTTDSSGLGQHIIYKHSDIVSHDKYECGYKSTHHQFRSKRDTLTTQQPIRGPWNANDKSRYLELVLVVDNTMYKMLNRDTRKVIVRCKDIANILHSLYEKLNIMIALVGVVVWTERDDIEIDADSGKTLGRFLTYRRDKLLKDQPNDNAQLLTGMSFKDGVIGKSYKGVICTSVSSGGINVDQNSVVGLVAGTVAHEMGHSLGMGHDNDTECVCPSRACVMGRSQSSVNPSGWSSCSEQYLAISFDRGMDYCMRNKPAALFNGPVCGNGFVEAGEECDCGSRLDNSSTCAHCCNATTCTLHAHAQCATGNCCDLMLCQLHAAGHECRVAVRGCDLPEFCTGDSEFCPDDVFKMNGEICSGHAYCYEGSCRTLDDQCRLLWGPSGTSADNQCFKKNTQGNKDGNCGFNLVDKTFTKCNEEDIMCGLLQCNHLTEELQFGVDRYGHQSSIPGRAPRTFLRCYTALVDTGLDSLDQPNPGLSPDGARCAPDKMCVHGKCTNVTAVRTELSAQDCVNNCSDQGVCNSRGHCHCYIGWAPPYCDTPGVGGSVDSGPSSNPNESHLLITLFFTFLVTVVPLSALILILKLYTNHSAESEPIFMGACPKLIRY